MTSCYRRERSAYLIGRLINTLTLELDVPIRGGRCTTLRREARQCGLDRTSATGSSTNGRCGAGKNSI